MFGSSVQCWNDLNISRNWANIRRKSLCRRRESRHRRAADSSPPPGMPSPSISLASKTDSGVCKPVPLPTPPRLVQLHLQDQEDREGFRGQLGGPVNSPDFPPWRSWRPLRLPTWRDRPFVHCGSSSEADDKSKGGIAQRAQSSPREVVENVRERGYQDWAGGYLHPPMIYTHA